MHAALSPFVDPSVLHPGPRPSLVLVLETQVVPLLPGPAYIQCGPEQRRWRRPGRMEGWMERRRKKRREVGVPGRKKEKQRRLGRWQERREERRGRRGDTAPPAVASRFPRPVPDAPAGRWSALWWGCPDAASADAPRHGRGYAQRGPGKHRKWPHQSKHTDSTEDLTL